MVSKPHGGKLVSRVIKGRRREALLSEVRELPKINLSKELAADTENIARGVYSPLEGFMISEELEHVLNHMRLPNDVPWTIPVVLDVGEDEVKEFREGEDVALYYLGGPLAIMKVEEVFKWDKEEYVLKVFKTKDLNHPGVRKTFSRRGYLVGGTVDLLKTHVRVFEEFTLWPAETRVLFRERGWRRIVGFQTRNVPHLGHEYVQKAALTFVDGLFINPLVGWKKPGDFRDEVIIAAYRELIKHYYPKDSVVFAVLHMEIKYAGPREAVHHAIIRKNFGCTHFIIGRAHASVGNYYGPYEAWEIFREFPDLGITPLFISESFYCRKCGGMVNARICPHSEEFRVRISGTKLREMLRKGVKPPPEMMRPEVAKVILSFDNPFT